MLSQFFESGDICPSCGNKMHLYMHWDNSMNFSGKVDGHNQFMFTPMITDEESEFFHDVAFLSANEETLEFSSKALENEAKKHRIYFFYLCNPRGMLHSEARNGRVKISIVKGCSYRSTPIYEFKKDEKEEVWKFGLMDQEHQAHTKDENFAFVSKKDGYDKIYVFGTDYLKQSSTLYYYTASAEQKKTPGWKPNIFEKTLPLVTRLDFSSEAREKLIDKFDSWIIMS